jgi:ribosomal protein S18 acetylase RimI-like enzyme
VITLRPAHPIDAPALARLKLETFRETFLVGFGVPYPPADLAVFEASAYGEDNVARELADPEHRTWIGERDGALLAYAHVGPCKLPHPDVRAGEGELYQLYVRGAAQGEGLGGRLLQMALDHLEANRPGAIWLGVWSGNHRAQDIYRAKGFEQVGTYEFPVGAWRDQELIFRRPAVDR